MNYLILLFGVLASASTVAAPDTEALKLIPKLLAKSPELGAPVFKAKKNKKEWVISFCPDETCDIIRAPSTAPSSAMGDFAALYLYYVSSYIYLKNFYLTDARPYIPAILARNSSNCHDSSEFARASCALSGLAAQHAIRLAASRADEGNTNLTTLDPIKELNESHITEIKAWQAKAWNIHP